jgi:hypothetical protein
LFFFFLLLLFFPSDMALVSLDISPVVDSAMTAAFLLLVLDTEVRSSEFGLHSGGWDTAAAASREEQGEEEEEVSEIKPLVVAASASGVLGVVLSEGVGGVRAVVAAGVGGGGGFFFALPFSITVPVRKMKMEYEILWGSTRFRDWRHVSEGINQGLLLKGEDSEAL